MQGVRPTSITIGGQGAESEGGVEEVERLAVELLSIESASDPDQLFCIYGTEWGHPLLDLIEEFWCSVMLSETEQDLTEARTCIIVIWLDRERPFECNLRPDELLAGEASIAES